MEQYLMIGEVLKPQGVRGEVKVKPYAADTDAFYDWTTLYVKRGNAYEPIEASCSRVHDGFAYLTLGGCASMNDAEKLRGVQLYIDRDHANALEEGEVYIIDLIGCVAVDEQGREVGTLTDVLQHGVVDVYVFKTPTGTMMAPAIRAAFPAVDVQARRIALDSTRLSEVAVFED